MLEREAERRSLSARGARDPDEIPSIPSRGLDVFDAASSETGQGLLCPPLLPLRPSPDSQLFDTRWPRKRRLRACLSPHLLTHPFPPSRSQPGSDRSQAFSPSPDSSTCAPSPSPVGGRPRPTSESSIASSSRAAVQLRSTRSTLEATGYVSHLPLVLHYLITMLLAFAGRRQRRVLCLPRHETSFASDPDQHGQLRRHGRRRRRSEVRGRGKVQRLPR